MSNATPFLARVTKILNDVAKKHGCEVKDLIRQTRQRHLVHARHEALFRLYTETNAGLNAVATIMERDRSTVRHGIKMHKRRRMSLT